MKRVIFALALLFLFGCSKSDSSSTSQSLSVTPSPVTPSIISKNYLQTSYELQKTNVNIDLMAFRAKNGINSGWNILPVAYLDVNGDGMLSKEELV